VEDDAEDMADSPRDGSTRGCDGTPFTDPDAGELPLTVRDRLEGPLTMEFEARLLDDDPLLLEQSYRLRYQVYCVERQFLRVEDHPDELERDTFDRDSIHVGALDSDGELAGTARLVLPNSVGFPLFHHCTLFPDVTTLEEAGNLVVEVSRVSISRHYSRRRNDPPFGQYDVPEADPAVADAAEADRRRRRSEPFLTLLRAIIYGAKGVSATHLLFATDAALHRRLVHFGFPYDVAGPEADYYGPVAPYIMSMSELDQVVLSRRYPALDGFPIGPAPDAGRRGTTAMEIRASAE
jgi:N-acyl amino acid synthase of PEP-CTERM/exosortase system